MIKTRKSVIAKSLVLMMAAVVLPWPEALGGCCRAQAQAAADPRWGELTRREAAAPGAEPAAAAVAAAWQEVGRAYGAYAASPAAERGEAFARYRAALEAFIEDPASAGRVLRPVARVDLAEALLVDGLQRLERQADGFVEFGIPTAAQREAFDTSVPAAAAMLAAAEREFLDLQAVLTRAPARREALAAAGVDTLVFDVYRDQKLAWYAASAGYLSSMVSGAAAGGGGGDGVDDAVLSRLRPWLEGERATNSGMTQRAQSLAGRVVLGGGDAGEARRRYLGPAVSAAEAGGGTAGGWSYEQLAAALAEAAAAGVVEGGRGEVERAKLEALRERPAVEGRFEFRLLVCDALHRWWLMRADEAAGEARRSALAEAYGVYDGMRSDPRYGAGVAAVEWLIVERWAAALPEGPGFGASVGELPASVRAAVAGALRQRGQAEGGEAGAASLRRAVAAGDSLDDRTAAGDAAWARGRYEAGLARYLLDPGSARGVAEVIEAMAEVAEQTPDQPAAASAIDLAMRLGEAWHRQTAGGETEKGEMGATARRLSAGYERAGRVLYGSERFATTPAADDRRVYYAAAVLTPRGDYEDAVSLLERQPRTHPQYLDARAEMLRAMTQWLRATEAGPTRDQRASDLLDMARQAGAARRGGEVGVNHLSPEEAARRLDARARLAEAEVSAARGDIEGALSSTAALAEEFADQPAVVAGGLARRVLWLVEAGRWPAVQAEARALMDGFPDVAAGVIVSVLAEMEPAAGSDFSVNGEGAADRGPANAGGGAGLRERSAAAAEMARQLADWAAGRGRSEQELVPLRLAVVRALRQAGSGGAALAYLQDSGLARSGADQAAVLYEHARALLAVGVANEETGDGTAAGGERRRQAAELLNRVIAGLEARAEQDPGAGYPDLYWSAWVTRLEVVNRSEGRPGDIRRRVEQLRQRDPALGGEPYRSRLEALGRGDR